MKSHELNSKQKVAALFLALGEDIASTLLKSMSKSEALSILNAVNEVKFIDRSVANDIAIEFYDLLNSQSTNLVGNASIAERYIKKSGLENFSPSDWPCFKLLEKTESKTLASILLEEHPQVIAVAIACLPPSVAYKVIQHFPAATQIQILLRISNLNEVNIEVLRDLEETLTAKIKQKNGQYLDKSKITKNIAKMLSLASEQERKTMLEALKARSEKTAERIEQQLLTFEDIKNLADHEVQLLIKKVTYEQWILALRMATPDLLEKICKNQSRRIAARIKEDLSQTKKQPKVEVERAQQRIIATLKDLIDQGKIDEISTN